MQSRRAEVEPGYRCPFCPDHIDDVFYASQVFDRPICEGCSIELDIFMHNRERPDDKLIDSVDLFTGRPWRETRVLLLKDDLHMWESLDRERPVAFVEVFAEGGIRADPWTYVRHRIELDRQSLKEADVERRPSDAV